MEEYSWLSVSDLENATELVINFYDCYLEKPDLTWPILLILLTLPDDDQLA